MTIMKKVKLIPILMALITALAGCSASEEQRTSEEKASRPAESTQTAAVETTATESTTLPQEATEAEEPDEDDLFTDCGAANLVNSGICCSDGERFYYSDTNTRTLYQTENGTASVLAEDFYGYYLNLDEDTIYYADAAADNRLTAYDLNSGDRTVICDMFIQELKLYKGKLYFASRDDEEKTIYRMNPDGSELEELVSCEDFWYMTIYKDVIYYVNYENDQYAIAAMDLDGSDRRIIRKYNGSDLCIAEDKIFFAERDTRYLYSMNLDGSDVQQLNSTYSRCVNYMNGQLYYYGSKENGRNVYSCDLNGNVTGRYASGAKFLMLMEEELYYYDWDEVLHIVPLNKKSEEENYSYGTNIVSYGQEDVLRPVRRYIESNWSGYTLDEGNITKNGNTWTILLTENGGSKRYEIIIDLTTGKVTILCITEDILPVSVYLFDEESEQVDTGVQLSKEEMEKVAYDWCIKNDIAEWLWEIEYHDYDGNGTYEAFAICAPPLGDYTGNDYVYNSLDAVIFISSDGEITLMESTADSAFYIGYYWVDEDGNIADVERWRNDASYGSSLECLHEDVDYYIEYEGKGYYLTHERIAISSSYNMMYGVKNDKPYLVEGGHIGLDEDGDLIYVPASSGYLMCPYCTGRDVNGDRVEDPGHKHILFYNETSGEFEVSVKYPSGEIVEYDDLFS